MFPSYENVLAAIDAAPRRAGSLVEQRLASHTGTFLRIGPGAADDEQVFTVDRDQLEQEIRHMLATVIGTAAAGAVRDQLNYARGRICEDDLVRPSYY